MQKNRRSKKVCFIILGFKISIKIVLLPNQFYCPDYEKIETVKNLLICYDIQVFSVKYIPFIDRKTLPELAER